MSAGAATLSRHGRRGHRAVRAGAVIAVVLALGFTAGLLLGTQVLSVGAATGAAPPADASVDAGFARDMQAHHAQAVQMSTLVRDRVQDEQVRTLALDVLLTQQQQAGQMYGWLTGWGLPQTSARPPMAWAPAMAMAMAMGDGSGATPASTPAPTSGAGAGSPEEPGGSSMPGMATAEQVRELAGAQGQQAARVYLQLMVDHHRGGVDMAEVAAEHARTAQVRDLAATIATAQSAEIIALQDVLADRGGPVALGQGAP